METPLSVAQITRDFSATRFFWRTEPFTPKKTPKRKLTIFENTKQVTQDYDKYLTIRFPSAKMTYYGLRISEYRACRACTCALAPAADEYNLNVVDCNALSLSHAGLPSQSVEVWGTPSRRRQTYRRRQT